MMCVVVLAMLAVSSANGQPTDPKVYGQTFGEWSASWWQWFMAIPTDMAIPTEDHPFLDETGEFCDVDQKGKVWFLAGNGAGSDGVVRECTVPNGRALLFPILNALWWAPEDGETLDELREAAKESMDGVVLDCTFDSRPCIFDYQYVRTQSPGFAFENGEIFGLEGGRDLAVSDGYWVMLPAPSKGEHVLHFSGTVTSGPFEGFEINQTYELTIE
jgi:hypothetical protein